MIAIQSSRLQAIGLSHSLINAVAALPEAALPDMHLARIIEIQRDQLTLHDGLAEHHARTLPWLAAELHRAGCPLAVGDWVLAQTNALTEIWVAARVPPLNQLARRAGDGSRQPLVSNVDTALLVMGLDHDYNPRRLERYLALTHAAGVQAVVVLSKADIGELVPERIAELRARLPAQVPLLALNGLSGQARAELQPWLGEGQTLVLLGSSGAGKSTLTNTLLENANQATSAVREGDSRGRHTTTARSLHRLPGGACIIDTPGLRTWRADADAADVSASFEDIDTLATLCRFRDCQHHDEPGCAVRDAIDADRLRNYHKLLREVERSQMTALQRREAGQKWKAIGKAGNARARAKRM
ncbi:ribosome small subunit-dependent GTPase A [Amantichitinum ursilacus]|uniref:Small ribosomal subunit biogenesis GTPase RsgA n=1 Tax=Amantichitinum ursilacus TaxID=857265 RepID=A0A0N0GPQ3_9NEIS|nr:ribosome small subunit-dependent GTPase A [Amantichitinum ursilacus]KPC53711.1 putative ribosome biogenesis GTPase RsgA [Amantichitinum ursilacus]